LQQGYVKAAAEDPGFAEGINLVAGKVTNSALPIAGVEVRITVMASRLEQLQAMLQREPTTRFCCMAWPWSTKKPAIWQAALAELEKVVQLDPGHGYAFFQRGQIEELRGNTAAAKMAYSDGIIAAGKVG